MYYYQINQTKYTLELLKGRSRSDFRIMRSHLTTRIPHTIPPFKTYMGAKVNIKFKTKSIMFHCQKRNATAFKYI